MTQGTIRKEFEEFKEFEKFRRGARSQNPGVRRLDLARGHWVIFGIVRN
jgi:hypothetical protein